MSPQSLIVRLPSSVQYLAYHKGPMHLLLLADLQILVEGSTIDHFEGSLDLDLHDKIWRLVW